MPDTADIPPPSSEQAAPATFFNVDVECTATVPSMGYLLTVGIVPVVHSLSKGWVLHRDRLYVRLDHGIDALTIPRPAHYTSMPWWVEQSDEAQDEAYRDESLVRVPPSLAARMIVEFVEQVQPDWSQRFFTANPVSFDKPWLDDLFAHYGMPSPFHYRSLCLRSMKFGMDPSRGFGNSRESHDPVIPHHALHDAEAQALDLIDMLEGAA